MTAVRDRETPSVGVIAELDERRRLVTEAMSDVKGKDLADLTESEYKEGIRRVKLVQARMQEILAEVLVKDAHFGNPKNAFKTPILYKGGAEELRRLMRLTLRRVAPDEIIAEPDFCSVVVSVGIFDAVGRLLATRRAACTTKEKRFKKFDGAGWTYDDAREMLHNCMAMAEKRAGGLLTCEVSGATAFFSNGETMEEALEDDKPIKPWTSEEKQIVYAAAAKKRMGRNAIAKLVMDTLGTATVGTGDDVEMLLAAINAWEKPKPEGTEQPAAAAPAATTTGPAEPAAATPELGDAAESDPDLQLDKKLADQERGGRGR